MPFPQDPKKRICCAKIDPLALSGMLADIEGIGETLAEVAEYHLNNQDEPALKEALARCDDFVEIVAKLRAEITLKTASARALLA